MSTMGQPRRADGLRNLRYGEIFLVEPRAEGHHVAVYNTTGLNACPQEWWDALDPVALAQECNVPGVRLNGPRFWTVDRITSFDAGGVRTFAGRQARLVARLVVPPGEDTSGAAPKRYYDEVVVERENEYLIEAGAPVYSLHAPGGATYVMQAYAHIVDDTLTAESLGTLGERLRLPRGWRYSVRVTEEDEYLRTVDGKAHVVQDELENTYVLAAR
ncbi:hypothetical protein [Streptomyces sp. NPDC059564]|uniref:hypothetical protein n=1 Tax=Streptomyces sp. NPDC059564 TaxID=3346865 RepID=UPI0036BC7E9A